MEISLFRNWVLVRIGYAKRSNMWGANVDTLNKLAEKVNDHDRSILVISKTLEGINQNLARFADTNEELRKEMTKHYRAQDTVINRIGTILEKLADYEHRFRVIDEREHNGCPSLKGHIEKNGVELQHFVFRVSELEEKNRKNSEYIEQLQREDTLFSEKMSVTAKRVKGLEDDKKKTLWLLLTAFIGIGASLIQGAIG